MAASRSSRSGRDHQVTGSVLHRASAGQRATPRGRDPLRTRPFSGRQTPLRRSESVEPTGRTRHRDRRGSAHLGRRRRALRRRPGRRQGLRQQLGRAPARRGQHHRPGRSRHARPGGSGAPHRQRRFGLHCGPEEEPGGRARSSPACTRPPWPSPRTAVTSWWPTPAATRSA